MTYGATANNTNSAVLVNPAMSQLAPYVSNPRAYRCPADQSMQNGLIGLPRVRSYSMSQAVGIFTNGLPSSEAAGADNFLNGNSAEAPPTGGKWIAYTRESQMRGGLGTSDIWVLIDEHPDSIDDTVFAIRMAVHRSSAVWINEPSKLHNNACGISFADGYSEIHRWKNAGNIYDVTYQPPTHAQGLNGTPNDDVLWLCQHTSAVAQ